MMKKWIIIACVAILSNAQAQTNYLDSCTITFEKKMHVRNILKKNPWAQRFIANIPAETVEQYTLIIKPNTSYYFYSGEELKPVPGMWGYAQNNNQVQVNLADSTYTMRKDAYEKKVLITDSNRQLQWTITNEYRSIAGYQCRQATTIMYDSIPVYAFYTPMIVPSAGPETFNGLPGCILGLAIPKLHVNWYATTVKSNIAPLPEKFLDTKKTENMDNAGFYKLMNKTMEGMEARWKNESTMILFTQMLL